jgi:predicted enzyme related to lactoylglutathione lyase
MSLTPHCVTFDAADALRLAEFWSAALGRPVRDGGTAEFAVVDDGAYLFIRVPERKTAKNRMHLDLDADDREAEVQRLVALGATRLEDHDDGTRWTVMADPEGNEFCIIER